MHNGKTQAAALSAVSASRSGVASGVLSTMRYLGGVIGVSVISVLLDAGSEAAVLSGHRACILIYIAWRIIGVYLGRMQDLKNVMEQ